MYVYIISKLNNFFTRNSECFSKKISFSQIDEFVDFEKYSCIKSVITIEEAEKLNSTSNNIYEYKFLYC